MKIMSVAKAAASTAARQTASPPSKIPILKDATQGVVLDG